VLPTAPPTGSRTGRVLPRLRELAAFGTVGAVCFLIDIGMFQLLYVGVGVDAVLAKLFATLVSMTAAFLGHRFWSFSDRARTGLSRESLRFAVINGGTLCLGLAIVAVVRYPLGQDDAAVLQAANVASIALGTVVRYVSYRHWVFPARPRMPAPDESAGHRADHRAVSAQAG
jgi:putative flippase GtrA